MEERQSDFTRMEIFGMALAMLGCIGCCIGFALTLAYFLNP